jgi:hypothetical protein
MPQITLVTDKHNDNVCVGVVPQLFQPSADILVSLMFADVVDEQGTDGTAVVRRGNGAVAFLARGVPDLRLDRFGVDLDRSGGKLDADGGLGVQVELVSGKSAEKVRFSNSRVSDQND